MFDTGAILHDRYTVERVLARGGMATVYIVRHNTLDTQYALKVLDIPTADIRRRLLQEGRIQASLKHPNIVAVTDAIELDGSPALVMEYVDGPPLSKLIDDRGYTLDQALVWFRQVVSAVSYAHARGLIHRDLKPENVLMAPMTGGYLPKVADFGIAKVVQEYLQDGNGPRTQTGIGMGTPAYMPPEQVQSAAAVDHRADVFALGCILYELVCGERAFPGDNLLSILNAIADADYTPPWEHRESLPTSIVAAIDGALEPDVERRIQSCDALLKVLSGDIQRPTRTPPPVRARQARVSEPPVLATTQRGWAPWLLGGGAAALIAAIAVAVVGVGLLGALLWWSSRPDPTLITSTSGLDPKVSVPVPAPPPPAPVPVPAAAPTGTVGGEKVLSPAFDVQIHSWRTAPSTQNGVFNFTPEDPSHVLWLVSATVTRNDTTHDINHFPWALFDGHGREWDAPLSCSMSIEDGISPSHFFDGGETLEGTVCFVAPADIASPEVRFTPLWGSDTPMRFPLQ